MQNQEIHEDGNLSTIFKTTIKYVDTRIDLLKLMLIKKASDSISSVISRIVAILIFLLAIMLLSIGFAIWLGKYMGGLEYGFLSIGGFFVLVGIILFAFKTKIIKTPVSSALIKKAIK